MREGTFTRTRLKGRRSTISKEEFLQLTKSVWIFPAVSAREVGHPAPFPIELPYRLIQLYTFKDEAVLDPFVGSGSTCIAALKAKRLYVGYDIEKKYVDLAERRIKEFLQLNSPTLFDELESGNLDQGQSFSREKKVTYMKRGRKGSGKKQPTKQKVQRDTRR